jgi:hypothetical protein
MDAYNRHVWKETVAEDADTLARLTNEALAFMRAWDQVDMHIEVVAVSTASADFPEMPPKKQRKLLAALPE